jgi:hypothetical protein
MHPVSSAIRLARIFSNLLFIASGLVGTLLQNHIACSVQDTLETRSITQIEADRQLSILQLSAPA